MFNHKYDYRLNWTTQSSVTNNINHDFYKIWDNITNFVKVMIILGSFFNQKTRNSEIFFASSEKKKPFKRARDGAYCPIT